MPNATLFRYSLTIDNRRWQNYAFRFFLIAAVLFMLFQYHGSALFSPGTTTAAGLKFFVAIAHLNLLFISLVGVCLFSSVITEEKEVNAVNLLLMTGLTPLTLLLSKSSSKLILGVMLLAAQMPFTILAATLGGVGERQIFACYASFLTYLFYVCNLSLLSSVLCRRTGQAVTLTFILLVLGSFDWLGLGLSPFIRVSSVLTTGFNGGIFAGQCVSCALAGAGCFLASLALFNRFTREAVAPGTETSISFEGLRKLKWFRPGRVNGRVFTWKDFHFMAGGRAAIWMRIVFFTGFIALLVALTVAGQFAAANTGDVIIMGAMVVMTLDVIIFSSRVLRRELADNTLSLIALVPIDLRTIIWDKYKAVFPVLVPSTCCLAFGLVAEVLSGEIPFGWGFGVLALALNLIFFAYLIIYSSIAFKAGGAAMAVGMYLLCVTIFGLCGVLAVFIGPFYLHRLIIRKLREKL